MVKTGLKVYKNNIWHFFTILGFVALGVIIGISILIPAMSSVINDTAKKISTVAGSKPFDVTKFFDSLFQQFKAMDWTDPLKTLQDAFSQTKLVDILTKASIAGGLDPKTFPELNNTITTCATSIVNTSITELIILAISVGICSIIGYVSIRTVIH